jgi:hypothetical protein
MGVLLAPLVIGGLALAALDDPADRAREPPRAGLPDAIEAKDVKAPGPSGDEPNPVRIVPRQKRQGVVPGTHADGWAEGGEIEVKVDKDSLTASLTGAAAAHCRFGALSSAIQTYRLVQEFDVISEDPEVKEVVLTLESELDGRLWSRHKAGASLRLARATVAPAGRPGPTLALAHPPMGLSGPRAQRYHHKSDPVEGPPMPLGRYVLVVDLAFDVQASGLLNAHAVADFSDEDELPATWKQSGDPFKTVDRRNLGFEVEVSAEPADEDDQDEAPDPKEPTPLRTGAPGVEPAARNRMARAPGSHKK